MKNKDNTTLQNSFKIQSEIRRNKQTPTKNKQTNKQTNKQNTHIEDHLLF
jgi:hypothetical protein